MGAQSSKEQFSSILSQLTTTDIDPTNHDFWDELWKTSLPPEDIFEVITPADIRKIISVSIFPHIVSVNALHVL